MLLRRSLCIWILCLSVGMLHSVECMPADSLAMRIFFRQGYRFVQPEFRDNHTTLEQLKRVLDEADSLGILRVSPKSRLHKFIYAVSNASLYKKNGMSSTPLN